MADIRHVVLTRFAVRIAAADGVAFTPGAALSPEWIARRFELFETYLLPSMQAQTFAEFEWRIFVHADFDPTLMDRLRAYDPRIVVTTDPVSPVPDVSGIVATTRIDSDDGFASKALAVVQRYAERFAASDEPARLLRLKMGWWLQHQTGKAYQQRGWSFLTVFERQAPYLGALVRSCDDIGKSYPEWTELSPLWVRVVHGGNVRNRFDARKPRVPLKVIQRACPWLTVTPTPEITRPRPLIRPVTRRPSIMPTPRHVVPVSGPNTFVPVAPLPVTDDPLPRLALLMRTTDRRRAERPVQENYVRRTVAKLVAQGVSDLLIQTSKATDGPWLAQELGPELLAAVRVSVPPATLTANATALAGLAATDLDAADFVMLLEDDLDFCQHFVPSVQRWLQTYGRPDRNVFRFFGFFRPPTLHVQAFEHPLQKLRASQAIALRREDAKDFLAWGRINLPLWRGHGKFAAKPGIAFDKFVAAWALAKWPNRPGVLSWPFFVDHIGVQSSLHVIGGMNHAGFAGRHWAYEGVSA